MKIKNILLPFRKYIVSIGYVHTNDYYDFFKERLVMFSTHCKWVLQFTALKVREPNPERLNITKKKLVYSRISKVKIQIKE